VTLAVLLAVVGVTIGFVRLLFHAPLGAPGLYLIPAAIFTLQYSVIYFIFLRKEWARWIFLTMTVLAFCGMARSFHRVQTLLAQGCIKPVSVGRRRAVLDDLSGHLLLNSISWADVQTATTAEY
jgi:hypothetical protein